MIDLTSQFATLSKPDVTAADDNNTLVFSAVPIIASRNHRIAKDVLGRPCILINVNESASRSTVLPTKLQNLQVTYDVICQVSDSGQARRSKKYTVIRCLSSVDELQLHFLLVMSNFIEVVGTNPSRNQIANALKNIIELFRSLTRPARTSIQGLWAEMFCILQSRDVPLAVEAWHHNIDERYDFADGDARIEVKSASQRERIHHFSYEQLTPPIGTELLIASVFVERLGAGLSIRDLISRIRVRLYSADLIFHFDSVVSKSLGKDWENGIDDSFDEHLARQSLAFFHYQDIPNIPYGIPPQIKNIHFQCNLENIKPVKSNSIYEQIRLFLSMV